MREYELVVILHPDLEIDQDKALAKIEKIITAHDGKILSRDDWGKRKLAYPIKKQQFGLYYIYTLELIPQDIAEIEHNLVITSEVLRHLLVKIEETKTADKEKTGKLVKKVTTKARASKKEQ